MKKLIAMLLALVMVLGLVACGGSNAPAETKAPEAAAPAETKAPEAEAPADPGKITLNIMSFTDEVPKMVAKYLELNPDFAAKYDVKTTIVATTDGLYQPALDQALAAGGADAPDLYCAEAAFILKYAQGDAAKYAAPYEDLGIDVAGDIEKAAIAQYSVDIGTRPADGKVVALGYQATGGAFIYRRSVAIDTFGTDDPAVVAEAIGAGSGNWEKFWEAAEALKAKGYGIISGDGDLWHAVENSSATGWIVDGKLNIDPAREEFLDLSKKLKDNGWHNDTQDWADAWYADMKGTGEKGILGFFGPAWLINYTIDPNCGGAEGTFGDWAVCAPPVGIFWGGTWLLANNDSPNKEAVGEIIHWITLNCTEEGLQYAWANGTIDWDNDPATPTAKDCVASGTVMEISKGDLQILGGQNMFEAFVPANQYANGKCLTQYDETINSYWRDAVRQYTAGNMTRDEAIEFFKQQVADNLDVEVEF